MDYDLSRLGWRNFEHLIQALALRQLGPGVSVFGDGPDGGREFSKNGYVPGSRDSGGQSWEGYIVGQAKYRTRSTGSSTDGQWLLTTVEQELEAWQRRRPRSRWPDYIVIATNATLSSVPDRGALDRVNQLIKGFSTQLGLRGWEVWHYDTICRMLDGAADIRKTYAGHILPGDVLHRLDDYFDKSEAYVGSVLAGFTAIELLADGHLRLGQAGDSANDPVSLGDVAIDLPIRYEENGGRNADGFALEYLLQAGDAARPLNDHDMSGHVVIGGPGQGKTTISQVICQSYRLAFLGDASSMSPEVRQAHQSLKRAFANLGFPAPAVRRWPFRIDLSQYAEDLARGNDAVIMKYMSQRISRKIGTKLTAAQLRSWIGAWPSLLILDGLDEVPTAGLRETIVQRVSNFLADLGTLNANVMLIVTTRPQGYTGEFSRRHFKHLELAPLTEDSAREYAAKLAAFRNPADMESREKILARVDLALQQAATRRLMTSPLQVTIMTLLLERRQRAPERRYALFKAYYDIIYEREAAKPGPVSLLLEQQKNNISAIHERVGFILHYRAESMGETESILSQDDLKKVAKHRLAEEEHDDATAERLAVKLIEAATHRLVLLVPRGLDGVSFEVRSLQEFMAARAITNGVDSTTQQLLLATAPSIFWRNVWLLAIGRLFADAEREYLRSFAVSIPRELDSQGYIESILCLGQSLAVDMLVDGVAAGAPKYERALARHALEGFERPTTPSMLTLTDVLYELMDKDRVTRDFVEALYGGNSGHSLVKRLNLWFAVQRWAGRERIGPVATRARQRLPQMQALVSGAQRSMTREWANDFPPQSTSKRERGGEHLGQIFFPDDQPSLSEAEAGLFQALTRTKWIRKFIGSQDIAEVIVINQPPAEYLESLFEGQVLSELVQKAYQSIEEADWTVKAALLRILEGWYTHRAVDFTKVEMPWFEG